MYLLIVLGIILKIVKIRVDADATDNYKLSTTRLLRMCFRRSFHWHCRHVVEEGRKWSLLSSLFLSANEVSAP